MTVDEIIRRHRPAEPPKPRKGVAWKTMAGTRKAQPAFRQPKTLAGIARQIGGKP